ncbi:MAG: rod shape-determining protein MreC [bacterium]|nr:rod shape-determining protein MreC [bacterium]
MKVARTGILETQKKWLVIVVTFVCIGSIEFQGVLLPFRDQFQVATAPILAFLSQQVAVVATPVTFIRKRVMLLQRLAQLEHDYAESLAKISELERVAQETVVLREMLQKSSISADQIITAARVSYAQPEIAAGSKQGVQDDMLVLVADTVVGRVQQVEANRSSVRLLTDQREKSIVATTESGVQGLLTGDGDAVMLTLVPQNKAIVPGERVTTVGQENVPAGLFVGTVVEVLGDPAEPTKQVLLEQYVSFFTAPLVTVR